MNIGIKVKVFAASGNDYGQSKSINMGFSCNLCYIKAYLDLVDTHLIGTTKNQFS